MFWVKICSLFPSLGKAPSLFRVYWINFQRSLREHVQILSGPMRACELTNSLSSLAQRAIRTPKAPIKLWYIFWINQESGRRRHNAARHHHQQRRSDDVVAAAPAGDQNIFHLLPFLEYIRRARVCCGEAITRERFMPPHISLSGSQGCQKCEWARERVRAWGHHRIIRGGCAGQQWHPH